MQPVLRTNRRSTKNGRSVCSMKRHQQSGLAAYVKPLGPTGEGLPRTVGREEVPNVAEPSARPSSASLVRDQTCRRKMKHPFIPGLPYHEVQLLTPCNGSASAHKRPLPTRLLPYMRQHMLSQHLFARSTPGGNRRNVAGRRPTRKRGRPGGMPMMPVMLP